MDLRRSPWILGVVLACHAIVCTPAGADEPNFTEDQKIDFLQHAKVVASKPEYWGYNIAGYRIAKLLGLDDMVPVYTERSWNGTKGAISWRVADVQFDEADRYNQKIQPPDPDTWAKQMYKLRVMTQLFYDMDANLTNVLITKDWKIWRIDFSRGFRLQHDLKDPKDLVQCDRQVLSKLRQLSYDQVFDATKPYLSKDEVKALIARRDKMVAYFDKLIAQKGESQVLY